LWGAAVAEQSPLKGALQQHSTAGSKCSGAGKTGQRPALELMSNNTVRLLVLHQWHAGLLLTQQTTGGRSACTSSPPKTPRLLSSSQLHSGISWP
jgi:hypothetical protein